MITGARGGPSREPRARARGELRSPLTGRCAGWGTARKRWGRVVFRCSFSWESDMARKMVEVENVNHPGQVKLVDDAMKRALLKILPKTRPGMTVEEIYSKVATEVPKDLFPAGAKAGWWAKTVQLDLEAKGLIARDKARPLRLRRV